MKAIRQQPVQKWGWRTVSGFTTLELLAVDEVVTVLSSSLRLEFIRILAGCLDVSRLIPELSQC